MTNVENLLRSLAAAPDYYELDSEHKEAVLSACREFLSAILKLQNDDLSGYLWEEVDRAYTRLGDRAIYKEVSPPRRANLEYEQQLVRIWKRFTNSNAIHLELGVSTAWPEARAAEYVRTEAIGDIIRLDLDPAVELDIVSSATALPFRAASIDRISSNSMLEHLAYPHEVLREAHRILKPGGVITAIVPFHFVQHAFPDDYLRYTGSFFKEVCAEVGFTEVYVDTQSTSGVYYTLHQLAKSALVASHIDARARQLGITFHVGIMALLMIGQALDRDMVGEGASHWHSTLVVAVKAGEYEAPTEDRIDRARPFLERHAHLLQCPRTQRRLVRSGEDLVSDDGTARYRIVHGVPHVVVAHTEAFERALRG
jgi:SAM-dependent methyltransferase